MCGIAGYLEPFDGDAACEKIARSMADRITNRGPDDEGTWSEGPIALAHRRLSILELSAAGHQPMFSACDRYVIVFNGEIYNHADLRAEVERHPYFAEFVHAWRGHSDTESILAAVACWGFAAALRRMVGMFAIALWDRRENALFLARDRFGEKPLYYGRLGRALVFASELKALRAHPAFRGEIDRGALALLMRHNYIPAPHSIYKNIRKLLPGTYMRTGKDGEETVGNYWSLHDTVEQGKARQFLGDDVTAVNELERVLARSVREQMVSDVPLGAFLSGGIDSSTIVALMQAQSSQRVKTFTIGFSEEGYNEAEHAKAVARHLGTDHTELYVSPQEAMDVIPRLPALYDEPFADSSQIPTFLVSQLAKAHVTVSLSGDAGDELFCGYNRYLAASGIWRQISALPMPLRHATARAIKAISPQGWRRLLSPLPSSRAGMNWGDKLHKGAEVLGSRSIEDLYLGLVSHWRDPASLVIGSEEPKTMLRGDMPELPRLSDVERMMMLDLLTYLPDDILAKVDRAAMGVSLETRVPFLDHRVVEFAWSLPQDVKLRNGQGKWLLRQVLYRHVPQALIDRPKMGFGIPVDAWLRGPLRDWATDLLDESRLRREGYFRVEPIRQKWAEHLSGRRNWAYHLWNVLMFQSWLDESCK